MSPREESASPLPSSSPFTILGIPPDSDDNAIKKAYRKLALQWHPDKHTEEKEKERAERKFKRIAHAYELLCNKSKRRETEQAEGRRRPRFSHPDNLFRSPFDVFRDFFGGRDPFADIFYDDAFTSFPSDSFFFSKHQQDAASRLHIFFDERNKQKNENECQFSTVIRFSSAKSPGENASSTKTTTTTKLIDGKKIVTKRTEDKEKETIEILENGELISRVVNALNSPKKPTSVAPAENSPAVSPATVSLPSPASLTSASLPSPASLTSASLPSPASLTSASILSPASLTSASFPPSASLSSPLTASSN